MLVIFNMHDTRSSLDVVSGVVQNSHVCACGCSANWQAHVRHVGTCADMWDLATTHLDGTTLCSDSLVRLLDVASRPSGSGHISIACCIRELYSRFFCAGYHTQHSICMHKQNDTFEQSKLDPSEIDCRRFDESHARCVCCRVHVHAWVRERRLACSALHIWWR